MAELARKRKAGKITVRYADGRVEVHGPGHFQKRKPKSRRATLAGARRSRHWKSIRRKALKRDGYCCAKCGGDKRLEVHHLTYERVGEEILEDLQTLCQPCHAKQHQWLMRKQRKKRAKRAAKKGR